MNRAMPSDEADRLLTACAEDVRGFIAGMGVPLDAVDDLAQDTFLAYLRHPEAKPADVEAIRWLKGIARHQVYAWFRNRPALAGRMELAEILDALPAVEEVPSGPSQRVAALRACLEQVPAQARALLLAYYRDDARSEDLAERAGSTASAVRMQLLRLRERLRSCVQRRLAAWGGA